MITENPVSFPLPPHDIEDQKGQPYQDLLATYLAVFKKVKTTPIGGQIHIESNIPIGAGLGSSAAVNVAVAGSVLYHLQNALTPSEVSRWARGGEIVGHGTPSGIDDQTSAFGGVLVKRGQQFETKHIEGLELHLVIGNTLVPRSTRALVSKVREYLNESEERKNRILKEMDEIALQGVQALLQKKVKRIGELMLQNQEYLREIGVSHPMLEKFIRTSLDNGAIGAKLTGAGGGGSMIALVETSDHALIVKNALEALGGEAYITKFNNSGVRVWQK